MGGAARPLAAAPDLTQGIGAGLALLTHEAEITTRAGLLRGQAVLVGGAPDLVVIVPGGGPIDRDGNGPMIGLHSDSYRLLADGLAAQGISSIRIDKRGFFASGGADTSLVSIADYAQDLRDWVEQTRSDAACLWLAGHSEGGIIALVAALAPPQGLCGVILMATPGRPVGQLLLDRMTESTLLRPFLPEVQAIVADIEAGRLREADAMPALLRPFFTPQVQRHMTDLFRHDPALIARIWDGPALIVQGDRDIQIPVEDASALAGAMPQARLVVLAGATHMLKTDTPGQPFASYFDPSLPLHPDLVQTIAEFIRTHQP